MLLQAIAQMLLSKAVAISALKPYVHCLKQMHPQNQVSLVIQSLILPFHLNWWECPQH